MDLRAAVKVVAGLSHLSGPIVAGRMKETATRPRLIPST